METEEGEEAEGEQGVADNQGGGHETDEVVEEGEGVEEGEEDEEEEGGGGGGEGRGAGGVGAQRGEGGWGSRAEAEGGQAEGKEAEEEAEEERRVMKEWLEREVADMEEDVRVEVLSLLALMVQKYKY